MNAAELISLIDKEYPNVWADAVKIAWINEAQSQLYTYMNDNLRTNFELYTVKNEPLYSLPKDCKIENIEIVELFREVPAMETSYSYVIPYTPDKKNSGYYDGLFGQIGFSPAPEDDNYTIKITYKGKPADITATTDKLTLDSDFIHLIKYFVLDKCASSGNKPDIAIASNFRAMYNDTLLRMSKIRGDRHNAVPRKKRCNPWW